MRCNCGGRLGAANWNRNCPRTSPTRPNSRQKRELALDLTQTALDIVAQLRRAGLNDDQIRMLADGKIPQGWQVHHKLPLDDGGANDYSNLVLIKNEPYHKVITNARNAATRGMTEGETRPIEQWPIPPGFVYPPTP